MAMKVMRFNSKMDVLLLTEVVARNPYANSQQWGGITKEVNRFIQKDNNDSMVSERGCRDRLKILLTAFKAKTLASLKASGTAEEYTQRDALLTEIVQLDEEAKAKVKTDKKKEQVKLEQGQDIRKVSMQTLKTSSGSAPSKKRRTTADYLQYTKEKSEQELKLREKEYELQRQRFDLEREERRAGLARDMQMMNVLSKLADKLAEKKEL